MESSRGEPTLPTAPLFLHVTCPLRRHPRERDGEGGEGDEERDLPLLIPTCLSKSTLFFYVMRGDAHNFVSISFFTESILFPDALVCSQPDRLSATYSVSLTLSFISFCPETVTQPATRPATDDELELSLSLLLNSPTHT